MATVVALKRLASRVHGFLGSIHDSGDEDIIRAGDFCIDLMNRTVQLRGELIDLTVPEFDLLAFLVSHPKRVITPRTLLATRYGERQVRQTEFLPVLLGLRKKIEASGASFHHIQIEPWVFYRFDPGR